MKNNYNVGDIIILTKNSKILENVGIIMEKYRGAKAKITEMDYNDKNGLFYLIRIENTNTFFWISKKCIDEIETFKKITSKESSKQEIYIKYHNPELIYLQKIGGDKSDWIDLRAAEEVSLKKGEIRRISLGISMQLPENYEAHVLPRSSTPEKFGIIMAHSQGIIDNSYCGDNDIWSFLALAIRDTTIYVNDRIAQFRIYQKQPDISFVPVCNLGNPDRGGFGSTGTK